MSKKVYFWIKITNDFFNDPAILKMRKLAGGDTYVIIFMKMLLLSTEMEGHLYFGGYGDDFAEEISMQICEDRDNVAVAIGYLISKGIIEQVNEDHLMMTTLPEVVGKETDDARRQRRSRATRKMLNDECDNVTPVSQVCHTDVTECHTESEKEKEKEKESELEEYLVTENGDTRISYKEIMNIYLEKCPTLPKVTKLTKTRRKHIKARWDEYDKDISVFEKVFTLAGESDFLSGRNGKWKGCSFDWLIKPSNFVKVLEGNYNRNNKKYVSELTQEELDEQIRNSEFHFL